MGSDMIGTRNCKTRRSLKSFIKALDHHNILNVGDCSVLNSFAPNVAAAVYCQNVENFQVAEISFSITQNLTGSENACLVSKNCASPPNIQDRGRCKARSCLPYKSVRFDDYESLLGVLSTIQKISSASSSKDIQCDLLSIDSPAQVQ